MNPWLHLLPLCAPLALIGGCASVSPEALAELEQAIEATDATVAEADTAFKTAVLAALREPAAATPCPKVATPKRVPPQHPVQLLKLEEIETLGSQRAAIAESRLDSYRKRLRATRGDTKAAATPLENDERVLTFAGKARDAGAAALVPHEAVVVVEQIVAPVAHGKVFEPGAVRGRGILYAHESGQILCTRPLVATTKATEEVHKRPDGTLDDASATGQLSYVISHRLRQEWLGIITGRPAR